MFRSFKVALAALGVAAAVAGVAHARGEPRPLTTFDVRSSGNWADRLALCDTTAFLASKPDLNANRMWVRRDDGHADLLLPPDFVGNGWWYKEGYQRLYWRLRHEKKLDSDQMKQAQNTLSRDFVESYRRANDYHDARFLRDQDVYCRSLAREQGEIIF